MHPWLHRIQPVVVQQEPLAVKVEPSQSGLDLAKDNLKFFVERWNEHPNSPYIFDTNCHIISPCISFNNIPDHRSRTPSLSGYSPSPCESISSLIDADLPEPSPMLPRRSLTINQNLKSNENSPITSPKNHYLDRLQVFDRRASDSSWLMKHNNDSVSRINLAEEIKKLSDKLLKINAQSCPNQSEESTFTYESEVDDNSHRFSSSAKINSPFSNFETRTETATNYSKEGTSYYYSTTSTRSTTFENFQPKSFFKDLWSPRRKLKLSSRDVPLTADSSRSPQGENFSDSSSTLSSGGRSNPSSPDIFPESSSLTRNILHLLGKYDDYSPKSEMRRTSLSVNTSEGESLGQRTMKTITNFLQSSRNISSDKKTSSSKP